MQCELRDIEDITTAFHEGSASRDVMNKTQPHNQGGTDYPQHFSSHEDYPNFSHKHKSLSQTERNEVNHVSSSQTERNELNHVSSSQKCLYSYSEKLHNRYTDSMDRTDVYKKLGNENVSLVAQLDNNNFLHKQILPPSTVRNSHWSAVSIGNKPSIEDLSTESLNNQRTIQKQSTGRTFNNKVNHSRSSKIISNDIYCKYNTKTHSPLLCHHFPCVTPTTYHTISNGGNEQNQKSNIFTVRTTQSISISPFKLLPKTTMDQDLHNLKMEASSDTITNIDINAGLPNKNKSITRWKSYNGDIWQSAKDPPFSPIPTDPVLERVRNEPIQSVPIGYSRSRNSIKDRIRGLSLLTSEMRSKNDRSKPRDWIINYGQQLPPRILLKPVLPGSSS